SSTTRAPNGTTRHACAILVRTNFCASPARHSVTVRRLIAVGWYTPQHAVLTFPLDMNTFEFQWNNAPRDLQHGGNIVQRHRNSVVIYAAEINDSACVPTYRTSNFLEASSQLFVLLLHGFRLSPERVYTEKCFSSTRCHRSSQLNQHVTPIVCSYKWDTEAPRALRHRHVKLQ
ncbi:unnamed protein product, partial [Dicrocoelium dendriticum]